MTCYLSSVPSLHVGWQIISAWSLLQVLHGTTDSMKGKTIQPNQVSRQELHNYGAAHTVNCVAECRSMQHAVHAMHHVWDDHLLWDSRPSMRKEM